MDAVTLEPVPRETGCAHLIQWAVGRRLTACEYLYLPPGGEDMTFVREDTRYDSEIAAVAIQFDTGETLALTWASQGWRQGLAVIDSLDDVTSPASLRVSATDIDPWRRFVGEPLEAIVPAWHQPGETPNEYLWSLRLMFNGLRVTIAVGGIDQGLFEYAPDELVVVFDEQLARTYRVLGATTTAWGDDADTIRSST